MKKLLLCIFVCLTQASFGNDATNEVITIDSENENNSIEITENSSGFTIDLSITKINHRKQHGYDDIFIEGCNKSRSENLPALPMITITSKVGELTIATIEFDTISIENMNIIPGAKPRLIGPKATEAAIDYTLKEDSTVYNSAEVYPTEILKEIRNYTLKSKKHFVYGIYPVQFLPLQKKIIVYKKLSLTLASKGAVALSCEVSDDSPGKMTIVTIDEYKEAGEKLQAWHRLKGYESTLHTQAKWDSLQVKKVFHDSYDATKNCYGVIIGDNEQVVSDMQGDDYGFGTPCDLYYACVDGEGDYVADIALGRISVASKEQAMEVVTKIINYEKNPPTKKSYYKTLVGCAEYSDGDDDFNNGGVPNGYADRRFTQSVEEIGAHMEGKGYDYTRIYALSDKNKGVVTPQYWNKDQFSFGEEIPDHLKMPGFKWDGDKDDIAKAINDGAFLTYHYDHGEESGWVTPEFQTSDLEDLTNKDMPTVVLSINCLSGSYDEPEGFAESFLRVDGGAAAIIAPVMITYSGWNEALMEGIVDARWKELVPQFPNKTATITKRDTLYCIGDMMNQGLLRMEESWMSGDWYTLHHFQIYHLFGDPSMRIWAREPQKQTPTYKTGLNPESTHFVAENLKGEMVYTTLLSIDGKEIIGTAKINNGTCNVPIPSGLELETPLLMSIVGADCKPYLDTIMVSDEENPEIIVIEDEEEDEENNDDSTSATQQEFKNVDGYSVTIAPNPYFKDNATIIYSVKTEGEVTFEIIKKDGTKLNSRTINITENSVSSSLKWETLDKLHAGCYYIIMKKDGTQHALFSFTKIE